jgi:hypothetical protein
MEFCQPPFLLGANCGVVQIPVPDTRGVDRVPADTDRFFQLPILILVMHSIYVDEQPDIDRASLARGLAV